MRKIKASLVVAVLVELAGCDFGSVRGDYDKHLKVCSAAERNGLLDSAIDACGAALAIADEERYEPVLVSDLSYRLGHLLRQRERFAEAEALMKRSLVFEEHSGNQEAAASRLVELALDAAGQNRWLDGVRLLDRAFPLLNGLHDHERKAAIQAFRLFGARLSMQGHSVEAERINARVREMANANVPAAR